MKIVHEFSHLGGLEIIHTRFSRLEMEVRELIGNVLSPRRTKISHEKTRLGRPLYAPKELNRLLKVGFRRFGWSAKRVNLSVEIPGLTSDARPFKEIDFVNGEGGRRSSVRQVLFDAVRLAEIPVLLQHRRDRCRYRDTSYEQAQEANVVGSVVLRNAGRRPSADGPHVSARSGLDYRDRRRTTGNLIARDCRL